MLLIAPDLQEERAFRGLQLVDYISNAPPSAFLVESGGALVSDGARQPRSLDALFG
jgi:hypothetical protein